MSDNNTRKFNRGRYMTFLTVITVCCVILGSLAHLAGALFWRFGFQPAGMGQGVVGGSDTLAGYAGLDLDMDIGSLKAVKGSEFMIEFENYPQGMEPTWEMKGDTLVVSQKSGMNWGKNADFNHKGGVKLTIPEGSTPDMDIHLAMGGLEISDLAFGSMVIDLDMGACTLTDCSMSGCTVDADMGSCTFTDCSMFGCDMDADMGEITLKNCSFTDGTFDADMGNIKLIDAEFASADCNADMGNVEVSGSFTDLKAECSMGSVKVTTDAGSENASMDLKTDMGKVTVNGENRGSEYKK